MRSARSNVRRFYWRPMPEQATKGSQPGAVAVVREGHELVQSGPYRFVRHPIYAGLLFAMFGTAITIGTAASYVAVLLAFATFLVRIRIEDALMASQFPEVYPAYKQQTPALIPFLW